MTSYTISVPSVGSTSVTSRGAAGGGGAGVPGGGGGGEGPAPPPRRGAGAGGLGGGRGGGSGRLELPRGEGRREEEVVHPDGVPAARAVVVVRGEETLRLLVAHEDVVPLARQDHRVLRSVDLPPEPFLLDGLGLARVTELFGIARAGEHVAGAVRDRHQPAELLLPEGLLAGQDDDPEGLALRPVHGNDYGVLEAGLPEDVPRRLVHPPVTRDAVP